MKTILFDEEGITNLGDLGVTQLHNVIASAIGEEPFTMPVVSSKEAANYTSAGTPAEHCAICLYWTIGPTSTSPGLCHIVAGDIDPAAWCRYFRHVSEAAE